MSPNSLVLVNCKVYVRFAPTVVASGMVVNRGNVVYVGDEEKALKVGRLIDAEALDLEGKVVLPGFIDAHVHLDSLGLSKNALNLRGVRSIEELKRRLGEYAKQRADAKWLFGRGWDQELFVERRWPTKEDLDEVVADRPVMLERVCGHAAVLNTKALEELVTEARDGIVTEGTLERAWKTVRFPEGELERYILDAAREAASHGVTTACFAGCSAEALSALIALDAVGRLPVRVMAYVAAEAFPCARKLGLLTGGRRVKVIGVKAFADGSLGARTAWLSEPYSDDPSTRGVKRISEEELVKLIDEVERAGLQLAVHAIGDSALDLVLKAYASSRRVRMLRHRVEHASVARPEQIRAMAELGICASVQPRFVMSDWWAVERVGERRAPWVYAFRSMLEAGVRLGFSTDAPVEPLDPWETVYAAVTRGEPDGIPLAHLTESEKLSVEEALFCYTLGSAYISHAEAGTGSLEVGRAADFVVVDRDPLEFEPEELRTVKVTMTVVGGEVVYEAKK